MLNEHAGELSTLVGLGETNRVQFGCGGLITFVSVELIDGWVF